MRHAERLLVLAVVAVLLLTSGCDGRGAAPELPEGGPRNGTERRTDTGPEDDAEIRSVVAAYLESVTYPDPPRFDPECVASDVYAVWSSGKTYEGREAFMRALQEGIDEVALHFESLALEAENQVIGRKGKMAWVYTRFSIAGVVKEGRHAFKRTSQSTIVLEKRSGRWQMVHEASSRLPE